MVEWKKRGIALGVMVLTFFIMMFSIMTVYIWMGVIPWYSSQAVVGYIYGVAMGFGLILLIALVLGLAFGKIKKRK